MGQHIKPEFTVSAFHGCSCQACNAFRVAVANEGQPRTNDELFTRLTGAEPAQPSPYSDEAAVKNPVDIRAMIAAAKDLNAIKRERLTEGRKDDAQKIRVDLYPPAALLATSRGLTYGADKYAPWNWAKGIHYMRVYGALLRHLFAWVCGEKTDPESGLHHLDHAGCCLAFLQHYESDPERYKQFDDRPECLVKA